MKFSLPILLLCLFYQPSFTQPIFTNIAPTQGVIHSSGTDRPGGGVSFCDFNGDGWDDLTLATGNNELLHFYRNVNGQLMKQAAYVDNDDEVKHILWVDFDNDGDKDLYFTTFGEVNRLYRNDGNLSFTDITEAADLPVSDHRNFGASWGDYNRDGWLDLYFGERKVPQGSAPSENRLYKNNADGTFTEVTDLAGVADPGKIPFCTGFLDINDDRWPDLYVVNDKATTNAMFQNNGDGTFTDISVSSKTDVSIDGMSIAMGDYDHDGREDIYVSNIEDGSNLLHNLGPVGTDGHYEFEEVAGASGVGFYGVGWGANWLDADNDGDLDIYVSGLIAGADAISSAFYINEGDLSFSEPDAGFVGDTVTSFSNAIGDINRDGYPEIAVLNQDPWLSQLWKNSGGTAHWVKVKLQGVFSNRDGVGSKIELFAGSKYQLRYTHCGSGFLGQNSDQHHFGLSQIEIIDSIRITWPTGHIDRLQNIAVEQMLLVVEGSTTNGDIAVDEDVNLVIVGTDDPALPQHLEVYPNPTVSSLQLNWEALPSSQFNYAIFDLQGKLLAGQSLSAGTSIDVQTMAPGSYLLVLWNGQGEKWVSRWGKI